MNDPRGGDPGPSDPGPSDPGPSDPGSSDPGSGDPRRDAAPLPRWFRLLLRLLPARFRDDHEAGIVELMADYAMERSWWDRWAMYARAAADALLVAASLRFGGSSWVRGGSGGVGGLFTTVVRDAALGVRSLSREPGLTLLATGIVGLGIGASATVFSVGHALLARPLPFQDPDRLVWISNGEWGRGQRLSSISVQVTHVWDLHRESRTLEHVVGYSLFDRAEDHTLTGDGEPERLSRLQVTAGFFELLGVEPARGRLFEPEEITDEGPRAILLTHGFWTRRFGSDPSVVGRALAIDDAPATVVGVLPATFDFSSMFAPGSRVDYVSPFPLSPERNRQGNTLALIGRLRPGVTLEGAQAETMAIAERAPDDGRNAFNPTVQFLREHISGGFRPAVLILAGSVAMLMLIVCANLSHLLLARGTGRRREVAIRMALGASRSRLVRQLLTESLVLGLMGAGLGIGLAVAGTGLVTRMDASVPLLGDTRIDGPVLTFTLGLTVLTALVFGIAPAVEASGSRLHESMNEAGRGRTRGGRAVRTRRTLIVVEVAIACVLLVGAGLLTRSFVRVAEVDLGFDPEGVVALRIDPSLRFANDTVRVAYYSEALRSVREAPGVDAAALTDVLPTAFNRRWGAWRPTAEDQERETIFPYMRVVSEGLPRVMGLDLMAGRDFREADDRDAVPVAIVNHVLVERLFGAEDPLGRTLFVGGRNGERRIVGVVRGTRYLTPEEGAGPEVFVPLRQLWDHSQVHLVVRGTGGAAALTERATVALSGLVPRVPVGEVTVVEELVDRAVSARRMTLVLIASFASAALGLACLGIYGVISYSVRQRRDEIAIRLALGASSASVRRRVLRETMLMGILGLLVGLPAAWALSRVMQSLLFEVPASDPITFGVVPAILLCVAALAAYAPATWAARVEPMKVLVA